MLLCLSSGTDLQKSRHVLTSLSLCNKVLSYLILSLSLSHLCLFLSLCLSVSVCLSVCLSPHPPTPSLCLGVATRDVQVCDQRAKCTCCSWRERLTGLQSLRITLDVASSTTPNSASKTERRSKALWSSLYAPVGFCGRGSRTRDSSVMERTGQEIL